MAIHPEVTLSTKLIYKGKILNLRVDTVQLPNGNQSKREVVEYEGAVGIVALPSEHEILMVRQFRYPVKKEFLEIPAGKLERGEAPLDCAQRELREETGAVAQNWEKICSFYSTPGFSNEKMHLFLATNISFQEQNLDEDEFVEVEKMDFYDALQLIRKGVICDAKTIVSVLTVKDILNK